MSVEYGLLKGVVIQTGRNETTNGSSNHFHIIVRTGNERWRCPVNIRSQDRSEVWFKVEQPLGPASLLDRLDALNDGLHPVPRRASGLALDYVREPLFDRGRMIHLPREGRGTNDDIQDFLAVFADRARAETGARIHVFGSFWRNQVFPPDRTFETNQGIHDIHMNQGNDSNHRGDDGVFQDGGLLFWYPSTGWVGFFCAFDSQVWFTDDRTGHRLPGMPEGPQVGREPGTTSTPTPTPTPMPASVPAIGIIAALVNPPGADPGQETVTLFNASPADIELSRWQIVDRNGNRNSLPARVLPTNEAVTLRLDGSGAQLGNNGGSIRLLTPDGVQVDVVTYAAAQAQSGRILRF